MTSEMKALRWLLALVAVLVVGQAFAHGMSEAEKQSILAGGNLSYLKLGATHMLSGYDHLLFVFGIVFFLTNFKDIVKYITAFTVGHSVTLIWATFNGIKVNYFLIDAVIGLSVCYIAFVNLDGFKRYLQMKSPNLLLMIAGLGLIHGLGLSTRLQQLPLNKDDLLLNIISFNVGVELGQVLALAAMLVLLSSWRKLPSFKPFSVFSNFALIFGGVLLFLMQMHGYSHVSTPDEFGFSSDNHVHDHIKLDEQRAAAIRDERKRTTID
jgi:HupE / UreJ protein